MIYKDFHGQKISALGMGGLRFPGEEGKPDCIDRAAAQKVVDAAIACGINYFDTSHTYQNGDSERFFGEVLSKYPRDSYYLATKFYASYSDDIEKTFEEQLRRCQTDYFDFYLLHCLDEETIADYMDPEKDYLGYLLEQKRAGRIRYIGFSSHAAPETLDRFLQWNDQFDMALIQLNYLDWTLLDAKQQYELLKEHHIPIWVMEPMKGGSLSVLHEDAAAILREADPGKSISSWGFRFLQGLDQVHTVLSGMATVEQVEENAALFSRQEPLDPEEKEILQKAADAYLKTMGIPCTGCRYCCSTCPAQLEIPLLIKGYNEQKISEDAWRLGKLAKTKSAAECLSCGVCLKHCPQHINIPAVMKEMAEM